MSENLSEPRLPKGWTVDLRPTEEGNVRWELFRHQGDGVSPVSTVGIQPTETKALQAAVAAAIERSEPPPPPAWMVEVAREAVARSYDDVGMAPAARAYRAGLRDDANEMKGALAALRLALEREHLVVPREWTEEELLKAAREDVRKLNAIQCPNFAQKVADGRADYHDEVQSALQARRNMLKEGAVAAPGKTPEIDVEKALKMAWTYGWLFSEQVLAQVRDGSPTRALDMERRANVEHILSTLPTREA